MRIELTKKSKREFERFIKMKPKDLKKISKRVEKEVARIVEAGAKKRVKVVTGRLKNSIGVEEVRDGTEVQVNAPYAASEEYLGQAYLRPAIKQGTPEAISKAKSIYKKEAERKI